MENCVIDGDGVISVTLPNDSPDGEYTAELIWNDGGENKSAKKQVLTFAKTIIKYIYIHFRMTKITGGLHLKALRTQIC
ncbi:MAG: hypothetical protein L6V93_00855 [Clostridiales bacterium]|nr:MAG: hypothetical protein L6V93_00855 [Clostridiales bacterium]